MFIYYVCLFKLNDGVDDSDDIVYRVPVTLGSWPHVQDPAASTYESETAYTVYLLVSFDDLQEGGYEIGKEVISQRSRRSSSAEPQSQARQMLFRSPPTMRRRESAAAVPYSVASVAPSAGTWSPHRSAAGAVVPEVKLVPDTSSSVGGVGGGATCVRATELTDEELEAMLYRLHRVRRRRASEAAAANHNSSLFDTSAARLLNQWQ